MRYLVISDIHSNLDALEAVLETPYARARDGVLVLGDLVGYGAEPNAVVDRIRELNPAAIVRGNHDKVAAGLEDAEDFNPVARTAADWTRAELRKDCLEYLRALPIGPQIVNDTLEISHGSPLDEDLYVVDDLDAVRSLEAARRPVSLFGHTHVALCARIDGRQRLGIVLPHGDTDLETPIDAAAKYLVNPGSVGQPRDGDPRAAYAIVDLGRNLVTLHRVSYPIKSAQNKILAAGLPPMLAQRLAAGR